MGIAFGPNGTMYIEILKKEGYGVFVLQVISQNLAKQI
jgi:hypothetical protein